jgi:hypothetical protein
MSLITSTLYDRDRVFEMLDTNPTLTLLIPQKDFAHNNNCVRKKKRKEKKERKKERKKLLLLCLIHTNNNTNQCENV